MTLLQKLGQENWVKSLLANPSASVYLVGGIVRDSFMGRESKDIDIVVSGISLEEIKRVLLPLGKFQEVGKSFQVIKFKPHGWEGEDIDIATPRKDIKNGPKHTDFITVPVQTIEEDLRRRDFTVNSMAIHLPSGQVIDPFGGLADIENKIIRATDSSAFIEDPLRIMRAIQFASRFEFQIEPQTESLIMKHFLLMENVSGERIREEIEKVIFKGGNGFQTLCMMYRYNIDMALMGKKWIIYHVPEKIDYLGFFYLVGKMSHVKPSELYLKKFKGDKKVAKALDVISEIQSTDWGLIKEVDARYEVFRALKKSTMIEECGLLHRRVELILEKMNAGEIPKSAEDIQINGNDIQNLLNVSGEKVGEILQKIHKSALLNEFNWSDKIESLNFVKNKFN